MNTKSVKYIDHNARVFNFNDHLICIGIGSDVDEAFTELKDFCSDVILSNPCFNLVTDADPGNLQQTNTPISTIFSSLYAANNSQNEQKEKILFYPFADNKFFTKRKELHTYVGTNILITEKGEAFPHAELLESMPSELKGDEIPLSLFIKSFKRKFKVEVVREKGKKIRTFKVLSPNGIEAEFETIALAKEFCKIKSKEKLGDLEIYQLEILENKKTENGTAPLSYKRKLVNQKSKLNFVYGEIKPKYQGKISGYVFRIDKPLLTQN